MKSVAGMKIVALAATFFVFFASCVLAEETEALYDADTTAVKQLNSENWNEMEKSSRLWVVEFYAPWCGHCKNLAPEFEQVAKEVKEYATLAAVDATKETALAGRFGVQSFPSIFVFREKPQINPYSGELYREAKAVPNTHLDRRSLKKMVKRELPSRVASVSSADLESWLSQSPENIKVLLFSNKKKASPVFKALSTDFDDRGLNFGMVSEDVPELESKFDVKEYPTILLLKGTEQETLGRLEDSGDMTYENLHSVFEKHASATDDLKQSKKSAERVSENGVMPISKFDEIVLKQKYPTVIFAQSKDTESMFDLDGEEWKKFRKDLLEHVGLSRAVAINCDENDYSRVVCEGIGGNGLYVMGFSESTEEGRSLDSAQRMESLSEAREKVIESIPDTVVPLTSPDSISMLVMEARQRGVLPFILLTSKEYTPPLIKSLAIEFRQFGLFGLMSNPGQDIRAQFGITKLPAIVSMFEDPNQRIKDQPASPQEMKLSIVKYEKTQFGSMKKYENLARFVVSLFTQVYPNGPPKAEKNSEIFSSDLFQNDLPDELPYLKKENFEKACPPKGLCVIGFFRGSPQTGAEKPNLTEALMKDVNVLSEIQEKSRKANDPFVFMWTDAECQRDFTNTFGVSDLNIPTIAVYSPVKKRYATAVGLFTEENARDFIQGVLSGRISTAPLLNSPELSVKDCTKFQEMKRKEEEAIIKPDENDEDMEDMMAEILAEEAKEKAKLEKQLEEEERERKKAEELKKKEEVARKAKKTKKKKKKKKKKKAVVKDEL